MATSSIIPPQVTSLALFRTIIFCETGATLVKHIAKPWKKPYEKWWFQHKKNENYEFVRLDHHLNYWGK